MSESLISPYGSWKSPITADLIVAGTIGLGSIALDNRDTYWIEARPTEAGRNVIVRKTPDGTIADVTPSPFNVRNRVHEYGGASYTIKDGIIYFSNFSDRRIYRQSPDSPPEALTPVADSHYADGVIDWQRQRLICVREDLSRSSQEPVNQLVSINLENGADIQILAEGCDFYASVRLHPDGSQLAWISWNHPNLPWDGTELWVAPILADGFLGEARLVAGGINESIFQPEWSPDGILYFISDRTNWWNLYRWCNGEIEPLHNKEAEFGLPQWVFGMSTYGFQSPHHLICTYTQDGNWYLARLNLETKQLEVIETPYTSISSLQVDNHRAVFLGGSGIESTALVEIDLTTYKITVLRKSSDVEIESGYLSIPQAIAFPTENNLTAYGFFYPPQNQDYQPPSTEKPPLIVKSHGGPTASTSSTLNLRIQYWTSRGFAVFDVNYGGSTGYGKEYRERLKDNWGIVDVDDCCNGAKYLAAQGLVDETRLAIAGGSAGGYTTLAALTFRDVFRAGASYYGISDLEALAKDTHKFEARYLDGLIGAYPERQDLYKMRSPIHFTDKLSCPVIFFQGSEDKVVPPNQAEMMVEALKSKGLPVAYILYEGEQHGFRRAENIKRTLEAELYFYSRIFGFELAEAVESVEIHNLE
ncbi:MAG TPA: peptidase [Cyanobacteria bacterium UBA11149]|nr:peptidase [Cyanobacteria bacterium UBA11367]HBE60259.1 peptidase [Cyanobacteria bacterium UBA11366]HBK62227.1 peptidase [Cyanobacteria bacterium UBA11166]HBR74314.1 peptidase [Cyanobacteria bacterium UBA11159]HBS68530.1 peptidase [Cyanobacteria bacterium UBA11153]HBW90694.1 peptidase [Cyanobacteria bacterium UBA11149]HCA94445.1 peptidase [Cyanobacteria bacterium UBA9226]